MPWSRSCWRQCVDFHLCSKTWLTAPLRHQSSLHLLGLRSKQKSSALLRSSTLVDKDKEEVTEYFNNNGFDRWNKIYSESDEVNNVQLDIRTGHGQTIEKVLVL